MKVLRTSATILSSTKEIFLAILALVALLLPWTIRQGEILFSTAHADVPSDGSGVGGGDGCSCGSDCGSGASAGGCGAGGGCGSSGAGV